MFSCMCVLIVQLSLREASSALLWILIIIKKTVLVMKVALSGAIIGLNSKADRTRRT